MSKVLIIGAGGVGSVVTHKCVQMPEVFTDIYLASRTVEKCEKISAALNNTVKTGGVNADNVPELVSLILKFQPDLVINTALPYQDLTIMDACTQTGVDYL
ncbi:MAG: saccharopine dehydrogenase NADP-binding domain-containing protein, partial [Kiritimatiellae bacterium]|nr:saccharopine dehydrogenase NADP-binding domain-containing protein [Kiritimatiellia bacterium]